MSHTGLKILYELVNRREDFACERVYAPWVDLEDEDARGGDSALLDRVVRAGRRLRRARVLAPGGAQLLEHPEHAGPRRAAGVAARAARVGSDRPRRRAVHGQLRADRGLLRRVPRRRRRGGAQRSSSTRTATAARAASRAASCSSHLAQIEGIYVPSLYDVAYDANGRITAITRERPARARNRPSAPGCRCLKPEYYPDKPMVPSVEIVQDRLGLEVMRGCTQGCRFCQAGYWYRPVRELDPGDVADMTKKFIAESGWSEVGLLSLSTADYSQIEPLVKCLAPQLSDRRVSISLPSLRAEAFSVGLADAVSEVRKSGFTFAPETGSDRLRRVINKTFTNDDMIQAADVAFARGWDLIKVYTMIGLPTEDVRRPRRARHARRRHPRAGAQARPQERQRRRRLLRAEVLDAVPVGALRRHRDPRAQALVPQGEVPQRARREDEVARAARSRDRVRALARRPARRAASSTRRGSRACASTAGPSTSATTSG